MRDANVEIENLRNDFEYFARQILKIKDKGKRDEAGSSGRLIPFMLNKAQKYVHGKLEAQLKTLGKIRAIILKGRQQGISTYVQARFFWKVIQTRGVRAFILTHLDDATSNLFEITDRFVTNSPVRIGTGTSNAKELIFPVIDSGYKVGTAGNKAVGISHTLQFFHGSEVAEWPNADQHKAGVMQAIADMPGTESILESTAKGIGGMYHDMYKDAKHGKSEYLAIFLPWYWQDEYRDPVPSGFKRTKEEQHIVKVYQLDDMQLAWRRKKIAELRPSEGGNPEDLFKEQYPLNDEEAFIFSGRLVFSASWLMAALDECYSPKRRAEINLQTGKVEDRSDGRLLMWQPPKSGARYAIGADVAEGLEHGDFSSCDVLDVVTGKQAAHWHGHIDPDQFGAVIGAIGRLYNMAFVGVEANNHGLTTLTSLRNRKYTRLYVQEDLTHRGEKQTKKLGWHTTELSKLHIIDGLSAALRDGTHGIAHKETIQECMTYIIDDNGKYTAKAGCYDDRVMSYAIAREMVLNAPRAGTSTDNRPGYQPADSVIGY